MARRVLLVLAGLAIGMGHGRCEETTAAEIRTARDVFALIKDKDVTKLSNLFQNKGNRQFANRAGGDYEFPVPPLHYACMCSDAAIVEVLLHAGASSDGRDAKGFMPIDRLMISSQVDRGMLESIGPVLEKYAPKVAEDGLKEFLVKSYFTDRRIRDPNPGFYSTFEIDENVTSDAFQNFLQTNRMISPEATIKVFIHFMKIADKDASMAVEFIQGDGNGLSGGGEKVVFKKIYGYWTHHVESSYVR